MTGRLAVAYSAAAPSWQRGPERIYDRLARALVERAPVPLTTRSVLDVGAGTGSASRAVLAAGAGLVVAVDTALGMLQAQASTRPPAVVADALRLPFRNGVFGAAVAAFALNHLRRPVDGLREMVRVTARGAPLLVASYAAEDAHPVKLAVEEALLARGWRPEPWYDEVRRVALPQLATADRASGQARCAGLLGEAAVVRVAFPDLSPVELVEWRLGLAQHAPYVSRLRPEERDALVADVLAGLGQDVPPLVRSIVVLTALSP